MFISCYSTIFKVIEVELAKTVLIIDWIGVDWIKIELNSVNIQLEAGTMYIKIN